MKEPFFSILIIFVAIFNIATTCCLEYKYNKIKEQAVERGYAEWVVKFDGSTTWQWKEGAK